MAERDIDIALRLVTSLPELVHLRVGYESAGWAERVVDWRTPTIRCSPPRSASPRGVHGIAGHHRARSLAALAKGRAPRRGSGRVAYPADVLADLALYRGDADAALTHYEAEEARARSDDDPIRLVWTCSTSRSVTPRYAIRTRVCPPRRSRYRSRRRRRTRRPGLWRATRSAWCSRSPSRTGRLPCSRVRRSWPLRYRISGGTGSH